MKRILACILLLLPLLVPVSSSAQAQEDGSITLLTSEVRQDCLAEVRYLAGVFSVLHSEAKVHIQSVNENELVRQVQTLIEAGKTPDMVNAGSDLLVALGEKGLLDTAMAGQTIDRIGRSRFYTGALNMLSLSGQNGFYGIPYHGWVQGIWYRADWFEEAGLKPPTTWTAILKAAEHFTNPEQGIYGILTGTDAEQYSEQCFTQLALANDALMFTPDGDLIFDSPAMVETLEYYVKLARLTPPGPQTWRARDFYFQGKLAMFFYSTFIMDDLALPGVAQDSLGGEHFPELAGTPFDPELARNTRLAPLLTRQTPASYGIINGFAIMKQNDPKKQETIQAFLDFLFETAQYVEWVHMAPGGMMPVLRNIDDSDSFMHDPKGVFRRYGRPKIIEIISGLESIQNFGMVQGTRHPLASIYYAEKVIPRMIHKAVFENVSAAQAVTWAAQEMRRIAAEQ
ncbi:MAG: ABC transporter substrate-binding protein [Proteobacteria bacterium]|nr:ABC transporter substrate-binding protein [Pseudomonadota bacterium]MBU1612315.1 ABC transporter substrate-binding protein [Pseudomonadota bacterium]